MHDLGQLLADNPVAGFIAASEIGFWVLLVLGMAMRYLLRWQKASTITLLAVPLLDLVLVIAVAVDLDRGATVGLAHGLAGIYLGFSVAFGPTIVRWADARAAHRWAGGPRPVRPQKGTPERMAALWLEWARVVLAASIASVVMLGLIALVGDAAQDAELRSWIGSVWVLVGLWLVFGPLWELPGRRRDADQRPMASARSSD